MAIFPHYHSLIPRDAAYVQNSVLGAYRARTAIDRTAYAITAIAAAILNTSIYLLQGIFTCDVDTLENCGKSLLFIVATVTKIFTAFCQENAFGPPPAESRSPSPSVDSDSPSSAAAPIVPLPSETPALASVAPTPTAAPIPLTDEEKITIRFLMTTLGKKRWGRMADVLSKKTELQATGAKVGHVHSLQLLHFIWTDPPTDGYSLRAGFCFIRKDLINKPIWSNFKENLVWTLERDRQQPDIHTQIDFFAQAWKLDADRVRAFIKPPQTPIIDETALNLYNENQKCDAEGFVDYLILVTVKET